MEYAFNGRATDINLADEKDVRPVNIEE